MDPTNFGMLGRLQPLPDRKTLFRQIRIGCHPGPTCHAHQRTRPSFRSERLSLYSAGQ